MITRAGYVTLTAAATLFVLGLAGGNPFVLAMSVAPFAFFLTALAVESPSAIRVTTTVSSAREGTDVRSLQVGDRLEVRIAYTIPRGFGFVEFLQPLPDVFEVTEGTNLTVAVKHTRAAVTGDHRFHVRCLKRGQHALAPVAVESVHLLGFRAPRTATAGASRTFDVRPRTTAVARIRGLSGIAKSLAPENDSARIGIPTTDFRDLRPYQPGDALKSVNWRATARDPAFHIGTGDPIVNEYEREGKKAVFLYIDAAAYMEVGTSVENAFEDAVRAANGIAQFYLDRGFRLGAYVYNHDGSVLLYPDVGTRQMLKLKRALTTLAVARRGGGKAADSGAAKPDPFAPSIVAPRASAARPADTAHDARTRAATGEPANDGREGFAAALDRTMRYVLQEKPLVIVVTRIAKADDRFFAAMKRLRALGGRTRRRLPILVISPTAHGALALGTEWGAEAARLLRVKERPLARRVRSFGATVLEWDARERTFESLLMGRGPRP